MNRSSLAAAALLAAASTAQGGSAKSRRRVYVASGEEARLTVAAVGDGGALEVVATTRTAEGCRTVVVDAAGTAYLPDVRGGKLVVVRPAR